MKRLFALLASAALLGAGCWQSLPTPPPVTAPGAETPTGADTIAAPNAVPTPTAPAPTGQPSVAPKPAAPTAKPKTTTTAPTQPATPPSYLQFVTGQLQVSSVLSAYGVDLAWTKASTPTIKGYALVKSTTDANPYYPKQFYFRFNNSYDMNTWRDTAIVKGQKTYYRVCSIGADDTVACGNVIAVTKP